MHLPPTTIGPGDGHTVLVVAAHADDPTLFCGGTVACWARQGWRVVVVRVTDDRWDSVGVDEGTTIAQSAQELRAAMERLGVADVVDLGLPTDTLADQSEVALRERIIRLLRTHRPHTLVTHDPHSGSGEDNQDHLVVGAAAAEAVWCAQFDKHHPEHLAEGLAPHGVFEQWYFGRPPADVTDVVDTGPVLDATVAAARCHELPMRNLVHQLRLQARTGGWRIPVLDDAAGGDVGPVVEALLRQRAAAAGRRYGLDAAEEFRVVRFGGLESLLELFGERLEPDATD
ncbi:MAG: PIG-L deacetylase family protein [Actinomycetes bacterium]